MYLYCYYYLNLFYYICSKNYYMYNKVDLNDNNNIDM